MIGRRRKPAISAARAVAMRPPARRSRWALALPYAASWPALLAYGLAFLLATRCGGW